MWGSTVGGRSPKVVAPPATPPPTSRYQNQRQQELEELRQRGLAKLLNKHFTSVTAQIAAERAAADAALKDLEARRANTKDYKPSPYELSVWDKQILALKEKRDECKRKEKETLLLYQRYVDKFGNTGIVSVPDTANMYRSTQEKNGVLPPTTPTVKRPVPVLETPVYEAADSIESHLKQHVDKGGDKVPSIEYMGLDQTYESSFDKADKQARQQTMRSLEGRGVDRKYGVGTPTKNVIGRLPTATATTSTPAPALSDTPVSKVSIDDSTSTVPTTATSVADEKEVNISAKSTDTDDLSQDGTNSAVSGLTTSSQIVADADARLLEFLKTETEAIRQMLVEDVVETSSLPSHSASITSAKTNVSEIGSQTAEAADRAEDMVKKMQEMLQDYQDEAVEQQEDATTKYPHELETKNPHDKWMVYYDEQFQREYYHEVNSNTVQWNHPEETASSSMRSSTSRSMASSTRGDDDYVPMLDFSKPSRERREEILSYEEVRPERGLTRGGSGGLSRRDLYRRKQRRARRKRRAVMAAVLVLTVSTTSFTYKRYHSDDVFAQRVRQVVDVKKLEPIGLAGSSMKHSVRDVVSYLPKSLTAFFPELLTGEEEQRMKEQAELEKKLEAERKAKAAAEAKKTAAAEAKKRAKLEMEQKARAEEEAQRKAEEEARELARKRPFYCNIPLAYLINAKCRILSDESPAFNLKELVDVMMQ